MNLGNCFLPIVVNFLAEFSHFFAKQINAKKEKISDEIKKFS